MFFKRENDFNLMRRELMDHYGEEHARFCMKQLEDFSESLISSLRSGVVLDDSFFEQNKANTEKVFNATLQKIEQVNNMSDGDVGQLYYKTFGRWRPIKS